LGFFGIVPKPGLACFFFKLLGPFPGTFQVKENSPIEPASVSAKIAALLVQQTCNISSL